mmetsp:Transcript_59217/g.98040  ORF Transcript_59217/g.98040 Transcript_59217/m.98040 type:complete len:414 (-) Transcript_59217:1191-2432(-)
MSGLSWLKWTMAVSAAFLAGSHVLLASITRAPSTVSACSGICLSCVPTMRSVLSEKKRSSATAARCDSSRFSVRSAKSMSGSKTPAAISAAPISGTPAIIAIAPVAATCVFSSSEPQKPTKILTSVESALRKRGRMSSCVTRLDMTSIAARCTSSLSLARVICSVRQPEALTMRSRRSSTVARLHRAMQLSNCWSSLSAVSISFSNGFTIDSGPEPSLRGYMTGLIEIATLASAHAAALSVVGSVLRTNEMSALKPPCCTILPRHAGVHDMERRTCAADLRSSVLSLSVCATSSLNTSTASSSTSVAASFVNSSGSSGRSAGGAMPAPPAANCRICSICAVSISFSSRLVSSDFSRSTHNRRNAEMSAKWKEESLPTDSDSATSEPKRTSLCARCSFTSGITERNISASTAHR